jgi:hypothetical protein
VIRRRNKRPVRMELILWKKRIQVPFSFFDTIVAVAGASMGVGILGVIGWCLYFKNVFPAAISIFAIIIVAAFAHKDYNTKEAQTNKKA